MASSRAAGGESVYESIEDHIAAGSGTKDPTPMYEWPDFAMIHNIAAARRKSIIPC